MPDHETIALGEVALTLRDVEALACKRVRLELSPAGRLAIIKAREVVDRLVDGAIPSYGITTGVGSQKDFEVSRAAIERYKHPYDHGPCDAGAGT
jgi:histidine ammonia-lyase